MLFNDLVVANEIRKLVIDCCRQNGGGHGGSAIGLSLTGVALWGHILRYNPANPNWFDRDRLVLSNGHACLLQYAMLHLTGYKDFSLDDLKGYAGDGKTNCFGHPEIESGGIEITTGPLGQGIANAVGMAIASKHLATKYNKPDLELIKSTIYCTIGDACLQEGVGMEAAAIAGHLKLNNLVVIYDHNGIICDGPLDWVSNVEDINLKMTATGWNVIDVFDGDTDLKSLVNALELAKSYQNSPNPKPTFIHIRTTIGYGTSRQNSARAHHGTYTDEDAELFNIHGKCLTHQLSQSSYDYFKPQIQKNQGLEKEFDALVVEYCKKYPKEAKLFQAQIKGNSFAHDFDLDEFLSKIDLPERVESITTSPSVVNGKIFAAFMMQKDANGLIAGGADLWGASRLDNFEDLIFGAQNYKGKIVRYGVREHAMAAISNGIAAYNPGAFVPITATFLMFYLYAAPGVRMGAICGLPAIHIATHDSINEGYNGPTHQPVEVDSLFRATPNLLFFRPASTEEVLGCWSIALKPNSKTPCVFSLSREAMHHVPNTDRHKVKQGGYVVIDNPTAKVTLVSTGVELGLAYAALQKLDKLGIVARLVSMPCLDLFNETSDEYKYNQVFTTPHVISIEPYVSTVWARYCTASISMTSFGYSASGQANYQRFGIDSDSIVEKVKKYMDGPKHGKWIQL